MSALYRMYPHEKAIVLNALYDALDAMGMRIAKADSVRGVLLILPEASGEKQLRLVLSPDIKDERTTVKIITANGCAEDEALASALFDEIASTIERAGMKNQ